MYTKYINAANVITSVIHQIRKCRFFVIDPSRDAAKGIYRARQRVGQAGHERENHEHGEHEHGDAQVAFFVTFFNGR